jgi:hypothetical protein
MVTHLIGLQARKSPLPPQGEGEGEGPIAGNWRERVPNPSPQSSRLAQGRGGKTFLKANIKRAGREKNGEQNCPRLFF